MSLGITRKKTRKVSVHSTALTAITITRYGPLNRLSIGGAKAENSCWIVACLSSCFCEDVSETDERKFLQTARVASEGVVDEVTQSAFILTSIQ